MGQPTWLLRLFPLGLAVALFALFSASPLSAQDDHGNFETVATPLIVGSPVNGSVDELNGQPDSDWFSFRTQRGTLYTIEFIRISLVDANVEVINSSARGTQRSADQTLTQTGTRETIRWVARTADTYYIRVAAEAKEDGGGHHLGDYSLTLFADASMADRHADAKGTATALAAENVYRGAVSPWTNQANIAVAHGVDDVDYFTFQARRGVRYSLEVDPETLDGVHLTLTDADDKLLATNNGDGETVTWISPASIRAYVRITGTSRVPVSQGTYSLRLTTESDLQDRYAESRFNATKISFENAHPGAISPEDDQDWFEFTAERGVGYHLTATLGTAEGVEMAIWDQDLNSKRLASNAGVGESLEWVAPASAIYFIGVTASTQVRDVVGTYSLALTSVDTLRDRHGDSPGRATSVVMGILNQGAISPDDDVDYFSFNARRGVTYSVHVESSSQVDALVSIENTSGNVMVTNGGVGQDLTWTAPVHGRVYVTVSKSARAPDPIGMYTITVSSDDTLRDRHGDDYQSGTRLSFGTTYQGAISPDDDLDYFTFAAQRGAQYTIELAYGTVDSLSMLANSQGGSPSTALRNFGDTETLTLIPWVSGPHYVEIAASPRSITATGTYALQVDRDATTHDRHSDSASGATRIGLRNAIAGAISPADDHDYFYFSAQGGQTYTVDVTPGTAEAVRFSVEGAGIEFAASNFGVGNVLEWTAPISGGYVLSVSASSEAETPIGTYQVTIYPAGEGRPARPEQNGEPAEPPPLVETEEDPERPALVVTDRSGQPGALVQTPIYLRRIQGVSTLEFKLGYNPAVLKVNRIMPGSRLAEGTLVENSDTPGLVSFGFAATSDHGIDGSVAVVEFEVLGQIGDSSPLRPYDLEIGLATGESPQFPLVGGEFRVESPVTGDGDGDGQVTLRDALIALKIVEAGADGPLWLDLDGDGQVTEADVSEIFFSRVQLGQE